MLEDGIIERLLPLINLLFLDPLLQYLSLNDIAAPRLSFGALRWPPLD